MKQAPSVVLSVTLARNRQAIVDQIVLGIISGGLLGPGLLIEERDSSSIHFSAKRMGTLSALKQGQILFSTQDTGETNVECRLWLGRGNSLLALGLLGLVLGFTALLGSRWIIVALLGLAGVLAILVERVLRQQRMKRLLWVFFRNLRYLKAQ